MGNKISLLKFFREGNLGGIKPGMTRQEVRAILGIPEWEYKSLIWNYGGVELYWDSEEESSPLNQITFEPYALHLPKHQLKLALWVFRAKNISSDKLKIALDKASIPYQDTGLELAKYYSSEKGFHVVPLGSATIDPEVDEILGTLVLKSGIQVRYAQDHSLIKVGSGNVWGIKASEQFITWD